MTPRSLLHIHPGYAIINPVRYYDRWWIASTMLRRDDSSLSMRSTWSIEINDRLPIEFFRQLFNDFLVGDSCIYNTTCGKTTDNTDIGQMHFYVFDKTAFDDDTLIKYELLNRMNK